MGKLHPADLFFTFAEIEDALARIHGIGADDRLMFRGRFHHLQKIGLFRMAKDLGSRLHYSLEEAYRAAFFMELIECGNRPEPYRALGRQALARDGGLPPVGGWG